MPLYVGTKKGLFIIDEGRWAIGKPHFLGDPVSAVLPQAQSVHAALNLGHFGVKLHRSDNRGDTWTEVSAPAYPTKPESPAAGSEDKVPWKLMQIWTLDGAGQDLWAGTIPGGLFHSTDRGESWTLVRSLWDRKERAEWFGGGYDQPGIHSVCLAGGKVTIAISCGGTWQSADGGASWRLAGKGMYAEFMPPERRDDPNIQDVHRLAQCAARPEVFWAQHHNGVFRSTDGAASFTEIKAITPSKFGFAVAAHPKNPDTAWFVPAVKDECRVPVDAKLVVARTRDGGQSFSVLRKGLPQENAYDLVYRHGLDVDASGNLLAFGSTTGGLWLSEDQGDSWRCLSAHLPPIHCVRFG
jgi:hypothetical protein